MDFLELEAKERLFLEEIKTLPNPDYLAELQQDELNKSHRQILIDWIYDVTESLDFKHSETFHLAVNYIDRYLSTHKTFITQLQLIGATSLFVAAKLTENTPVTFEELVGLSAGAFVESDIKKMEKLLLQTLDWKVSATTSSLVLESFIYCLDISQQQRNDLWLYADVFLGIVQTDYDFIKYLPTILAAAAMRCACKCMALSIAEFDDTMESEFEACKEFTAGSFSQVKECSKVMDTLLDQHFPSRCGPVEYEIASIDDLADEFDSKDNKSKRPLITPPNITEADLIF